jgi:hypothetical protein
MITLAKKTLLNCATPDSIIRLNVSRDFSEQEKNFLWNEYFVNQKHLSLAELLSYHISNSVKFSRTKTPKLSNLKSETRLDFNSVNNLIQIATHSKASALNLDINSLGNAFSITNPKKNIEVCMLQSFDTQQQFYNKVKGFFENKNEADLNEKRFLLIQTDLNFKSRSDLIACSRYTIVESFKEAKNKNLPLENCYLIFVINIPKENVKNFVGFQIGYWSCYHLDELEEPLNDLPPFESLKNKSLSSLLAEALNASLSIESEARQMSIDENRVTEHKTIDLVLLLKKIAHNACSLIVDTNLDRTIYRIELFTRLCNNQKFVNTIVMRLINLQMEKEDYMPAESVKNWLIKDAANFKTINEFSTLRRACQNYFESKLSPLLGYLLSFVDLYSNLNTFSDSLHNDIRWKVDLWIKLLENVELVKFTYNDMRSKDQAHPVELQQFRCQSDWLTKNFHDVHDENKWLKPSLPFFWLLINQLSDFYSNFLESNRFVDITKANMASKMGKSFDLNAYAMTISKLFKETNIYLLINDIISMYKNFSGKTFDFTEIILDAYIGDFLLMKCSVNTRTDLEIIKKIVKALLNQLEDKYKNDIKYSLPMVHYVFESIKDKLDIYLKFSKFEPAINKSSLFSTDEYYSSSLGPKCLQIDFDSCIECIKYFQENFKLSDCFDTHSLNKLYALLQLISQMNLRFKEQNEANDKIRVINEKFEALTVLRLFIDNIIKFDYETVRYLPIKHLFDSFLLKLNTTYFSKNVDFKNLNTIDNLHKFIIEFSDAYKKYVKESADISFENMNDNINAFYVDIIEGLCFKNYQKPNDDAIEAILKVITDQKIIVENNSFDLNLTNRSMLIQIVFRNYNQIVESHLTRWFDSKSFIGANQVFATSQEISLLFQNCVFDNYVHQISNLSIDEQIKFAIPITDEIVKKTEGRILERIFNEKRGMLKTFNVDFLLVLSKIKFILSILSKVSHDQETFEAIRNMQQFEKEFSSKIKRIIDSTAPTTNKLIFYLIKDMIRKYGSSSVKYVQTNEKLSWMTPKDIIGDEKNITDKYVLGGDKYIQCKDAIMSCFKQKNTANLDEILKNHVDEYLPYLSLAFYQNITLLFRNIDKDTTRIAEIFEPVLDKYYGDKKYFLKSLLSNSYDHYLKVDNSNWQHIDLNLLLMQIKYCVFSSESGLIKGLRGFILEPGSMDEKYLPTMPQDNLYDIKIALTGSGTDYTKFYSNFDFRFYDFYWLTN